MATNNAEGINVSVVTMGSHLFDDRPTCNFRPLTLARLHAIIDSKVIDRGVAEEVKNQASGYPQQALWMFRKDLQIHISRAQKKVSLTPLYTGELGDEPADK